MARLATTLRLLEPVTIAGRRVTRVRLREPLVRDFVAIGPLDITRGKSGLRLRLDLPGRVEAYLRRCLSIPAGCAVPPRKPLSARRRAASVDALLAEMSLADAMHVKASLARFFFAATPADMAAYAAILAFDWKLMPLDEADGLGLSELAAHCDRLTIHCKRRAEAARGAK